MATAQPGDEKPFQVGKDRRQRLHEVVKELRLGPIETKEKMEKKKKEKEMVKKETSRSRSKRLVMR